MDDLNQDLSLYNWGSYKIDVNKVEILDTSLRDGLQSPNIRYPTRQEKLEFIEAVDEVGIDIADIGFPAAGGEHYGDVLAVAQHVAKMKLNVKLLCLGRAVVSDIEPMVKISQSCGLPIEALILLGSSRIRHFVEHWDKKKIANWIKKSVKYATDNNLVANLAAEDATRSHPDDLEYVFKTAIEAGAKRILVADTVGSIEPPGVTKLIRFIKEKVIGNADVGLDYHGHEDRQLGVAGALAALEAGADRVHTTVMGIGERVGNTPTEPMMINLKLLGVDKYNLKALHDYSKLGAKIFDIHFDKTYPVVGDLVFTTSAGIHAAAILKARRIGAEDLVANVYSGIDPRLVGKEVMVNIGPFSGASNVLWYLEKMNIEPDEDLIHKILTTAQSLGRVLKVNEIENIISNFRSSNTSTS